MMDDTGPLTPEELAEIEAWNAGGNYSGRPTEIKRDVAKLAGEIRRLHARVMELIPIWNAIEQTRASIESTARLMGEAGHPEEHKMLMRWHGELHAALHTRIEP